VMVRPTAVISMWLQELCLELLDFRKQWLN